MPWPAEDGGGIYKINIFICNITTSIFIICIIVYYNKKDQFMIKLIKSCYDLLDGPASHFNSFIKSSKNTPIRLGHGQSLSLTQPMLLG